MAGFKIGRVTEDIHREMSAILRELKDPRISSMLSVVKVSVTNDMSHCKVYVSAIEGEEKTRESVEGLKSATGFIRRELGSRLRLRKCPELHFIPDDSIAQGVQINKMLEDLQQKKGTENT